MRASYRCDIGRQRAVNQDSVYCHDAPVGPLKGLFMVADGMGGHKAGEVASRALVDEMQKLVAESGVLPEQVREYWDGVVVKAGNRVYELSRTSEEYSNMGTTLVTAALFDERLCFTNIGDSRGYVLDKSGNLHQITRDHSLVQELVEVGSITREEARVHPRRNIITRAVGVELNVRPDVFFMAASDAEKILLCSDGLYSLAEDWEIEGILKDEKDPESAAERLLELALSRGGTDNISVVVVDLNENIPRREEKC